MVVYEYQNWKFVWDQWKNISLLHTGLDWKVLPEFSVRLGFFTLPYTYSGTTDEVILTGGAEYTYNNWKFTAGLMINQWISDIDYKDRFGSNSTPFHQINSTAGISYNF